MTIRVMAGALPIGGGALVSIQSMTNTDSRDGEKTLAQIRELAKAGCDLVRVSVFDQESARVMRYLADNSPVPLCADIHFDYRLAVAAAENGAKKLRLNPGNIGSEDRVRIVADCAKAHHIPIRVGVNAGSLEKDVLQKYGGATARGLADSALNGARILEKAGFSDIVLSMKASSVRMTVEASRIVSRECDYPLHIGVTEAGLLGMGTVKGAIGIGALLLDGIGDTVRVSLTGSPLPEAQAAMDILKALGLRGGPDFVSCPTCGRTRIDVSAIMQSVQAQLKDYQKPHKIAVMGCVVNGPGEARDADFALCGGDGCAALYRKGQFVKKLTGDIAGQFVRAILDEA